MSHTLSRREMLVRAPALCGAAAVFGLPIAEAAGVAPEGDTPTLGQGFPRQDLEAVQATVGAAHFNLARVKELVTARPELAKASWDWGFGDWENALGAASHTGRREIAEFLMNHGARPNLFTFAMLGNLAVVRATIEAHPGIQRTPGPHGITLLAHARAGKAQAKDVYDYLEHVGGADDAGPDLDIPDAEKQMILGTYVLLASKAVRLTVLEERDQLRLTGDGIVARRLVRVGALAYHPAGAPSVRVRFDAGPQLSNGLSIIDATGSLAARRVDD